MSANGSTMAAMLGCAITGILLYEYAPLWVTLPVAVASGFTAYVAHAYSPLGLETHTGFTPADPHVGYWGFEEPGENND